MIYTCIYIYRLCVFSGNRISELHIYIYTHMYLLFIYDLYVYLYIQVACVQWVSVLRIFSTTSWPESRSVFLIYIYIWYLFQNRFVNFFNFFDNLVAGKSVCFVFVYMYISYFFQHRFVKDFFIWMCIHMHECLRCVHVHIYIYTNVYIYIYVYTYMNYLHAFMCTYAWMFFKSLWQPRGRKVG